MQREMQLRESIISTALQMNKLRINQGTSGNVSVRVSDSSYLITPTGMPYNELQPEDMVLLSLASDTNSTTRGSHQRKRNRRKPSSEWRIHRDIYSNPEFQPADAQAIVHTHSKFATALACSTDFEGIPAFHYIIAIIANARNDSGGARSMSVPIAEYYCYGSEELSRSVCQTLVTHEVRGCLMRNHGVLAYGKDLKQALNVAHTIELLAEQYLMILQANLTPRILTDAEMNEVMQKFKTYGQ